jgi:hypothetical protein
LQLLTLWPAKGVAKGVANPSFRLVGSECSVRE